MAILNTGSTFLFMGSAPITSPPMTGSIWIKPTTTPETKFVWQLYNNASTYDRWAVNIRADNTLQALCNDTTVGEISAESSATIADDAWGHVCMVHSATTPFITIYINGSASGDSGSDSDQLPNATVNRMSVGSRAGSGNFDGAFQDFDVWSSEFTAAQVAALYLSGVGSSGLNQMRATHKSHSKLLRSGNAHGTSNSLEEFTNTYWWNNNGATDTPHHSMIYPAIRRIVNLQFQVYVVICKANILLV